MRRPRKLKDPILQIRYVMQLLCGPKVRGDICHQAEPKIKCPDKGILDPEIKEDRATIILFGDEMHRDGEITDYPK